MKSTMRQATMHLGVVTPILLCISVLAGCSSFDVSAPEDRSVVTLPNKVQVRIDATPQLSAYRVEADGQDMSAQVAQSSAGSAAGELALAAGQHRVVVTGSEPCWYCQGGSATNREERRVCVVPPGPNTAPLKIVHATSPDARGWRVRTVDAIHAEMDVSLPATRWSFTRLGGIASSTGLIESAELPCRCLISPSSTDGAPLKLAMCDAGDPTQQWQSLPMPRPGHPAAQRFQNNGRGVSSACITEGPASTDFAIIQAACLDLPVQLWTVHDNQLNLDVGDPW